MYTAPDGSRWHQGVRWYYDGDYHTKPQPNKPRHKGSYYHVFALVSDPKVRRVYEMRPGDQVRVRLPEIARRFANSHLTGERFDATGRLENAHFHPPTKPKD